MISKIIQAVPSFDSSGAPRAGSPLQFYSSPLYFVFSPLSVTLLSVEHAVGDLAFGLPLVFCSVVSVPIDIGLACLSVWPQNEI